MTCTMKGAAAFTSLIAPHIERYLTLKQALGREYNGVRRMLAHNGAGSYKAAQEGLLKGNTVAIDGITLEANAALRSIVRRDSGRSI